MNGNSAALNAKDAKDSKRLKILLAAEKMFAEKGYHKTTVEDITKAASVGKGTFYEYFASKDEALRTAVEVGVNHFLDLLLAEYRKCRTAREKVFATIYCCLVVSAVHGEALQAYMPLLLHNTSSEFSDYFQEKIGQPFFGILRNVFVSGMSSGEIEEQDADLLVHMLVGCIGGGIHYQCGSVRFSEQSDIAEVTDFTEKMSLVRNSEFHTICESLSAKITELIWQGVSRQQQT